MRTMPAPSALNRNRPTAPRRFALSALLALSVLGVASPARAIDLSGITGGQATDGVRTALSRAAELAVAQLGQSGGFLANPKVRIPLPAGLDQARSVAALMGGAGKFDELVNRMNGAAESVMPLAKPLLIDAVRNMSIDDARALLAGGDTAATDFFRKRTGAQIRTKIQPLVQAEVGRSGLARQYDSLAGQAAQVGVLSKEDASVDGYVSRKAVDGLFAVIAEQEAAIRKNPVETGSAILKRIFGGGS